jgi:predicted nuclease of restriction endonuclease-like (RecB) superfamily
MIEKVATYTELLEDLKTRVQQARSRAALAVNRELIVLYWQIGRRILEVQGMSGWGSKVVPALAKDLKSAFPDMKGFSRRNLLYMQLFAKSYPESEFVQQLVAQLPWGHNVRILDKVKTPELREQYTRAAFEFGWSRSVPEVLIKPFWYTKKVRWVQTSRGFVQLFRNYGGSLLVFEFGVINGI